MGKVTWHSLTEDGKVETVDIKFGNKHYKNISVNKLKPVRETHHGHAPKKKKKKNEMTTITHARLKEIIRDEVSKLRKKSVNEARTIIHDTYESD